MAKDPKQLEKARAKGKEVNDARKARQVKFAPTPKGRNVRAEIQAKQKGKFTDTTQPREARATGAGIPKKGFTDAKFNELFKKKPGQAIKEIARNPSMAARVRATRGGGGGPPGTLKFSQGVFSPFKRK